MLEEPMDDNYMTIQEAARYIGVSVQTLRRWDTSGKLSPVRHPVSGYRHYRRSDLEPFRIDYTQAAASPDAVREFFQTTPADVEDNALLREPQREAHRVVREHFANRREPAILQIPVGCGKTGIIATLPFGIAQGRVLVIAPNVTIRKGISEALDIAGPKCFWRRTQVLGSVSRGPFAAILDGPNANLSDCIESHFVVTNIQQLASSADRWLPQFPPGFFDMILVDEGHHNVADSWRKVFDRFPDAKVISLTATPFRSDQQPVAGEVIYRYRFTQAMLRGYIKQIHSRNVAPSEIYFTFRDDKRRHTLEEVLALREEHWFRKGVALAPECNRHIVEASILRCRRMRERTGLKHQIIAAACSVDHAKQVRALYEECGFVAKEIHSQMDEDAQDAVLSDLASGRLDCVVQVQMLGEGFDHPPLSIAAIFRPFRSLSPYIQFVGRVMRVIHENAPGHADNQAFIISHVGLNNDARWDDFRELDLEDQLAFRNWLSGDEEDDEGTGNGRPRRFDRGMLVDGEIVSHFIDDTFLDPEDDRVLDQLLAKEVAPGIPLGQLINRQQLQERLRAQRPAADEPPENVPTTPQRRRQTTRARLNERSRSVATRILQDLKLSPAGRDVGRVVPKARGMANRAALFKLMSADVNAALKIGSKHRNTPTGDELAVVFGQLDQIGDALRDRVRSAMEGKSNG